MKANKITLSFPRVKIVLKLFSKKRVKNSFNEPFIQEG